MNNSMLPLPGRVVFLTRIALDSASQSSWIQVEKKERGHVSPEPPYLPVSSANASAAGTAGPGKQNLQSYPLASEPIGLFPEVLPVDAERGDVEGRGRSINGVPVAAPISGEASLLNAGLTPDGSIWALPENFSPSTGPGSPAAVSSRRGDAGLMASGQALAASISGSLARAGPLAAAQELLEALRPLSRQESASVFEACHTLITGIFVETQRSGGVLGSGAEDSLPAVRTALVLARLAGAIDKDPWNPHVMKAMQDISAVVLASPVHNDNAIFYGLAQAVGVGKGSRLVLTVARQLLDRDGGQSRARAFLSLVLSGFVRLDERIEEAHAEVVRHLQPLLLESAGWRSQPSGQTMRAMLAFVKHKPILLENLESRLDLLEQFGLGAFRSVRDLAGFAFNAELREMHRRFVSSSSVLASIATSRAALREVRHDALAASSNGVTLEATRLMLAHIGFDAPRAAFLAELSQIGGNMMLGANWTALENFELMEVQGRTFQRLLAFLNGHYVVTTMPEVIHFDDGDMQF